MRVGSPFFSKRALQRLQSSLTIIKAFVVRQWDGAATHWECMTGIGCSRVSCVVMNTQEALLKVRGLTASVEGEERLAFARAVVLTAIFTYWREQNAGAECQWSLCDPPLDIDMTSLREAGRDLAQTIGASAAKLDVIDASYLIGLLYTGSSASPSASRSPSCASCAIAP